MTSVCFHDLVVSVAYFILTHIGDIGLGETAIGSQLLDITLCESIHVYPLVTAQHVVNRLIMNTLRELTLHAQDHLEVFILGVDIVERTADFLNIVMAALQNITGRGDGITRCVICIIRIVGGIEALPVNLCSLVIAGLPEINETVVLVFIYGGTNQIAVIRQKTGT